VVGCSARRRWHLQSDQLADPGAGADALHHLSPHADLSEAWPPIRPFGWSSEPWDESMDHVTARAYPRVSIKFGARPPRGCTRLVQNKTLGDAAA